MGLLLAEIHKITSLLTRRTVGEASKKSLDGSVVAEFNKQADTEILVKVQKQYAKLIEKEYERGRKDERERILNQMELERCDPDVMTYFEDFYWLPKSVWQALKEK